MSRMTITNFLVLNQLRLSIFLGFPVLASDDAPDFVLLKLKKLKTPI